MDWGPPYSTDIYGEKAFIFKNDSIRFQPDTTNQYLETDFSSMLYIPSKDSEDELGNAYFELLNENWPLFDSLFQGWNQSGMPHVIGLVQGEKAVFTQIFRGTIGGEKVKLIIENDGRVRYSTDDKWSMETYTGLSRYVIMPGKRIYLENNDQAITIRELQSLKNKYGSDITKFFDIEQK